MAICALIFGIVGCVFWFIPVLDIFAFFLSLAGIVLAAMSLKDAKYTGQSTGLALTALILSIVGAAFGGFFACICNIYCLGPACVFSCFGELAEDMMSSMF